MRGVGLRLGLATCAASLYTLAVAGGVITGTDAANLAARFAPGYFAALWVVSDARRTRYWPAYHYPLFVWSLPWLAVPHYVWRTRRRAGLRLAVGLELLLFLPSLAALAGFWLYPHLSVG